MTAQEINIAIAEASGWKRLATPGAWISPRGRFHYPPEQTIPDYLNNLNAMHEAEKVFRARHTTDFIEMRNWLFEICGRNADFAWHATAAQRAEAFLRTLGKWKD